VGAGLAETARSPLAWKVQVEAAGLLSTSELAAGLATSARWNLKRLAEIKAKVLAWRVLLETSRMSLTSSALIMASNHPPLLNALEASIISLRLITLNIRYATKQPHPGEEPWAVRRPRLCAQLKFLTSGQDSSFICLQEVLDSQLADVLEHLNNMGGYKGSWTYIGCGRDDGDKAGEYSPVLYRADRWECVRSRIYWLSQTLDKPSKGWDAACFRIVTVGLFRHRATGGRVVVMSTHLDHRGELAREESAKLIIDLARAWSTMTRDDDGTAKINVPVFLGGDFNSTPTDKAYKMLTDPSSGMKDISELVSEDGVWYGNRDITYTSFGEPGERPGKIDFLFACEPESFNLKVLAFGILPNRFDDGVYLSDHRPVVADLALPLETARWQNRPLPLSSL